MANDRSNDKSRCLTQVAAPLTPPEVADLIRTADLRAGYIIGACKDVREMRLEAEEIKVLLAKATTGLRQWWHGETASSAAPDIQPYGYCWFDRNMEYRFSRQFPRKDQFIGDEVTAVFKVPEAETIQSSQRTTSKDALWNLVRLAAEGSDWQRDSETLQEWAFRKLTKSHAPDMEWTPLTGDTLPPLHVDVLARTFSGLIRVVSAMEMRHAFNTLEEGEDCYYVAWMPLTALPPYRIQSAREERKA